jgi:hypothetical protein
MKWMKWMKIKDEMFKIREIAGRENSRHDG